MACRAAMTRTTRDLCPLRRRLSGIASQTITARGNESPVASIDSGAGGGFVSRQIQEQ
jgi:hypothetical protein